MRINRNIDYSWGLRFESSELHIQPMVGNLTTTCLHPEGYPAKCPHFDPAIWYECTTMDPVIVLGPGIARMLKCYESTLLRLRVIRNNIPHIHHGAHILFGFSCAISV
jgi:hypothetical protein